MLTPIAACLLNTQTGTRISVGTGLSGLCLLGNLSMYVLTSRVFRSLRDKSCIPEVTPYDTCIFLPAARAPC